ncbi:MAG: SUMF1/EgtB/PvdO family nonheme iron enzyme, partial [Burkholderiaceae bacterium]|nr:SUMF1/EgtB/PvdO family nonheme iron enzyme [Burkholderiaceae bacterium]
AFVVPAVVGWFFWHSASVKWAREQVPRIEQLAQAQKYFEAYDLTLAAQKHLPDDATITRLMPTISDTLSVTTEPAGAEVYLKRFAPDESGTFPPRQLVGTTPLNNLRIARGQYILYIEKAGYAKTERTLSGAIMRAGNARVIPPSISVQQKLIEAGKIPERMAFVPGGDYRLVAWARPTEERVRLDDYFIDKYEVSNQEYKEFINAGGYMKRPYWKYRFVKDGKTLSWDEAIDEFKDRTGLSGPRNWSNQNFPEGKAEYPVTDITWYEAAAYAAFRGKQLPTIFQWEKAARNGSASPLGNYMPWGIFYPGDTLTYHANFENNGTMPVSSLEFGMSPFGNYNMAGNVSEWCLNEISQGFTASGGAWGEPSYMFADYGNLPGFYSSNNVGFRCALNSPGATGDQGAMRIEINQEIPVYAPSNEASFNNWLSYYRYDKTPLDPQIVEVTETAEWRREKITFNGADGERAIAYLYLPKNFLRPLQVIHFMPASNVEDGLQPLTAAMENRLAPITKSGRAAFGVVIKGYIERLRPEGYVEPDPRTAEYREKIVNWTIDVRRGLDYLETRDDLDTSRIAFLGASAGARSGLILAAVENRYRSIAWLGAGLRKSWVQWIAEANPINFAPHIQAPKLMVHGRYDENLPLKTQAEPLYKLLREPKRLVLYDGGHSPPMEFFVPAVNTWLDETLG